MTTTFKKLSAPSNKITIFIDGIPAEADETETVAAVLLRQNEFWSRETAISGERRAPYCMMGVCFECLTTINGISSSQACLVKAVDGMTVERQIGSRRVSK